MTDWTTITDTQIDPKAPVTSELMTALRDNPSAITEGAAGAPRLKGEAVARASDLPVLTVTATTAYNAANCFEEDDPLTGEIRRMITRACTGSAIFSLFVSVSHSGGGGSTSSAATLKKNGTQVLSVFTSAGGEDPSSDTNTTSGSVSIVPTDIITLEVTGTGSGSRSGSITSITASDGYLPVTPLARASTL